MVSGLMIERLARALTRLSVDRPFLVSGLFLVLFALGAFMARRLELRLNYMELLPENAPEVVDLKWVMKKAGTEGYLVVELAGGTRDDRLAVAPKLADAIEGVPEVRYAEYRYDVPFFRQNVGSFIEMEDLVRLRKELDAKVKAGLED